MALRGLFEKSIQAKLTALFLLVLLPLVSVSLFSNQMSQFILKRQISERVQGSILSSVNFVEQIMQNVAELSHLVSTDKDVNEILLSLTQELSSDNLIELRSVQQRFATYTSVNRMIAEISILHTATGNTLSWESGIVHLPDLQNTPLYHEVIQANGGMIVYAPEAKTVRNSYWKSNYIYFIRVMDPYSPREEKNLVIIGIRRISLSDIVKPLIPNARTSLSLTYKKEPILSVPAAGDDDGKSMISFSSGESASGWELMIRQPEKDILQENYQIRNFTIAIMLVSVLLAFIFSLLLYNGISKPLLRLTSQMKRVSLGDLKAHVVHNRQDELGYVMNSFNKMVKMQKTLIEEGYEKELSLTKSRFRLLQSQINPHFLYNTLDCIYTVAEENDVHEVSEMVMNLAMFFRVSLGKGRETFTVEETVMHLMYYIRVQQIRLMDRFQVDIHVQPETKPLPLLRLLLQPLVENAIMHGFENKPDSGIGTLRIRIELLEMYLQIIVEDTGIGIEKDRLEAMQEQLAAINCESVKSMYKEEESASSQFFALKNVKSRLIIYYGEGSDLHIESVFGMGTKVILHIPVQTNEESEPFLRKEGNDYEAVDR